MMTKEPQIGIEPMTASLSESGASVEVVVNVEPSAHMLNPQGDRCEQKSAHETIPDASLPALPSDAVVAEHADPFQCAHDVERWAASVRNREVTIVGFCRLCRHALGIFVPTPYDRDLLPEPLAAEWPAIEESVQAFFRRRARRGEVQPVTTLLSEPALADFRTALEARLHRSVMGTLEPTVIALRAEVAELKQRHKRTCHDLEVRWSDWGRGGVLATSDDPAAYVYALVASDEPERCRYIGSTHTPAKRLRQHLGPRAHPNMQTWVKEVLGRGAAVQMRCLSVALSRRQAYLTESELIAKHVALAEADLNTVGGLHP